MATVLEDPRLLACSKLIENTSFYSEKKDMTTVLKSEKVSCGLFFSLCSTLFSIFDNFLVALLYTRLQ